MKTRSLTREELQRLKAERVPGRVLGAILTLLLAIVVGVVFTQYPPLLEDAGNTMAGLAAAVLAFLSIQILVRGLNRRFTLDIAGNEAHLVEKRIERKNHRKD